MKGIAFVIGLSAALAGQGATWRPPLPLFMPEKNPVETVLALVDAITAGDEAAMTGLIWASERLGHGERRQLVVRLIAARAALEKVAVEKFGEAGRALSCGYETVFSPAVRKTFEQAEVVLLHAGHGALVLPAGSEPVRLRRSVRGAWQVVLPEIETDREDEAEDGGGSQPPWTRWPVARYKAMIAAVEQARAGIIAGADPAFRSAESARTWLAERLAEIQRGAAQRGQSAGRAAPTQPDKGT